MWHWSKSLGTFFNCCIYGKHLKSQSKYIKKMIFWWKFSGSSFESMNFVSHSHVRTFLILDVCVCVLRLDFLNEILFMNGFPYIFSSSSWFWQKNKCVCSPNYDHVGFNQKGNEIKFYTPLLFYPVDTHHLRNRMRNIQCVCTLNWFTVLFMEQQPHTHMRWHKMEISHIIILVHNFCF